RGYSLGQQHLPGSTQDEKQPQGAQAKDRETGPPDRNGSGEYRMPADILQQVQRQSDAQGGENRNAQSHVSGCYSASGCLILKNARDDAPVAPGSAPPPVATGARRMRSCADDSR